VFLWADYDQVGRICYAYEKGTEWERNWFRLLASYVGRSNRTILERLACDSKFTQDDLKRIKEQIIIEKASEKILSKKPLIEETKKGKSLAVYDTSDTRGLYLGHKVFDYHSVDYCLIRISKKKWQIASNPSSSLTLESLAGQHNLDGMRITAGGRPKELLAIELINQDIPPDSHNRIVAWAKRML
jgi:hypothetical protein